MKEDYSVGGTRTNGGHDDDDYMLFDCEGAWVEGDAKELNTWDEASPKLDDRERQQ